ncbi:hypothetical protein [Streptomyces sp. HNM0574]|uniref:hypothetical protein n=1 Tax=Streptomyces sp. HNM0574 TaxID=2714954 RepID=UPI0019D0E051|nr:hypothetical protein [Streptomyces sp. HNM0574]
MTSGCKTTTVFLTILCGLLLAILGLTQEWPLWVWPVLVVLLAGAPAAAFRIAAARRGAVPAVFEEQWTAPPVERREHQVSRVALPSQWEDYDFLFSATVRWHPVAVPGDDLVLSPSGLAVDAVLDRARAITEQRGPDRASLVEHELNGALGRLCPDRTGNLQAMAENVTLVLRETDQERLEKLAEVRKDKAVWEHQRKYEQSRREYLGDDVLKDTGSAVVWWLAKNDDHIEKTVGDLGLLAQLTSAANDTEVPRRLRDLLPEQAGERPVVEPLEDFPAPSEAEPSAADHFGAFLESLGLTEGDVRRGLVAQQVVDIVKSQDCGDTAEELRDRFDPPVGDLTEDEESPDAGDPPDDTGDATPHG